MFFSVQELKSNYGIHPNGVIHVGAHLAEEMHAYTNAGWDNVIWIEAQGSLIHQIRERVPAHHQIIQATIWDEPGLAMTFHLSSNSQSSSVLDFGTHYLTHPDIEISDVYGVITETLERVLPPTYSNDFINLDLQGVELRALKGLGRGIENIKWIYSEVNSREVYVGCNLVDELDAFLGLNGFVRIATRWWAFDGWGDALYIRRENLLPSKFWIVGRRIVAALIWEIKRPAYYLARIFARRYKWLFRK